MTELLEFSFLSWGQFWVILIIGILVLLISDRFHLFKSHHWKTSIGYHLFFAIILVGLMMAFLAIRPLIHFLILVIVLGFIFKNIFAYVRSIFNLYFSGIHIGDRVAINKATGILENVNLGGMHIREENQKTYFPFNNWSGEKIVLLSQAGKVACTYTLVDRNERTIEQSIAILENELFKFPYLHPEEIKISANNDSILVKLTLAAEKYTGSFHAGLDRLGFTISDNN